MIVVDLVYEIFDCFVFEGLELKWVMVWELDGIYCFDCVVVVIVGKGFVFSVDIFLLIVLGSLYIGYVFSYIYMDFVVCYQWMCGCSIFYLMGWDDNGLFIECWVQNYYGVWCDLMFLYVEGYVFLFEGGDNVSSKVVDQVLILCCNFIEFCEKLIVDDEKQFEVFWCDFGLSVDWLLIYCMIGCEVQLVVQCVFLCNLVCGEVYQVDVFIFWDVMF